MATGETSPGPRAEFFSEGAYLSNTETLSNSVFARAFTKLTNRVHPFLQMGTEQIAAEQTTADLYFSPGIKFNADLVKIYGEHRLHQRTQENATSHEWRVLFVIGRTVEIPTPLGTEISAFWEPYSELLLSTADENQVLFQGLSRLGIKYQLGRETSTDLFIEPFLSLLQNSVGDENHFQIRPSVRARTCFDGVCLGISAARMLPTGTDRDQGFRFLATLGGMI
ncbi:MAG: hypothetical protein EBQ92_10590 [Proteobacteria bacterium]|nr:hypothetical protein [Pseudomonadota bacterium]